MVKGVSSKGVKIGSSKVACSSSSSGVSIQSFQTWFSLLSEQVHVCTL